MSGRRDAEALSARHPDRRRTGSCSAWAPDSALRSRPSPQLGFQHALQPARIHARRAGHLRIDDGGLERLFGPHEPDAGAPAEPQTETVRQVVKHLDDRLEVDTRLFLATIRPPGCTPAETKARRRHNRPKRGSSMPVSTCASSHAFRRGQRPETKNSGRATSYAGRGQALHDRPVDLDQGLDLGLTPHHSRGMAADPDAQRDDRARTGGGRAFWRRSSRGPAPTRRAGSSPAHRCGRRSPSGRARPRPSARASPGRTAGIPDRAAAQPAARLAGTPEATCPSTSSSYSISFRQAINAL